MSTKLNIGCGADYRAGYINVDRPECTCRVDVKCDLSKNAWPFESNSADEIVMIETLEHLPDTPGKMHEIHRILKPGGLVTIVVPYCKSDGAYISPEHVSFFHEKTFHCYTKAGAYNGSVDKPLFDELSVELTVCEVGWKNKLRNAIPVPVRKLLNVVLWNMFDGVCYKFQKAADAPAVKG